jgi:hypothetical protein
MPCLTTRDEFGNVVQTEVFSHNCGRELKESVELRRWLGWQVTRLAADKFEVKSPGGTCEILAMELTAPDGEQINDIAELMRQRATLEEDARQCFAEYLDGRDLFGDIKARAAFEQIEYLSRRISELKR